MADGLRQFALEGYALWSLDPFVHWLCLPNEMRACIRPQDIADPDYRQHMRDKFKTYITETAKD